MTTTKSNKRWWWWQQRCHTDNNKQQQQQTIMLPPPQWWPCHPIIDDAAQATPWPAVTVQNNTTTATQTMTMPTRQCGLWTNTPLDNAWHHHPNNTGQILAPQPHLRSFHPIATAAASKQMAPPLPPNRWCHHPKKWGNQTINAAQNVSAFKQAMPSNKHPQPLKKQCHH